MKSVRFKDYNYIGDPINTVRIFSQMEVDELAFLDIEASRKDQGVNFRLLADIADECFMPLAYGGGLNSAQDAKRVFEIGFEKVIINSYAFERLDLISEVAEFSGSQSVIGSIDAKKALWGSNYTVYRKGGTEKTRADLVEWARTLEDAGAGEILLTSIDRDGTWSGYDVDLIKRVHDAVHVPVIANGGAGSREHLLEVVDKTRCSAVGVGSMVVYQGKDMGVLITPPPRLLDPVVQATREATRPTGEQDVG